MLSTRCPRLARLSIRGARWIKKGRCVAHLSTAVDQQIVKKAMASLVYLREGEDKMRKNVADRNIAIDVKELFRVYRRFAALSQQIGELRHERNVSSRNVPAIKDEDLRAEKVKEGAKLKQQIMDVEAHKHATVEELAALLLNVPNWTHPTVPTGDYSQARLIKIVGEQRDFPFQIKDHLQLGSDLGIIDFQSASKTTGHSFYYLKGAAALLELAMVQYAVQKLTAKGFQAVIPPDVVREEVMEGCGFHPRGLNTQVYKLAYHHGDLCLSGTAEVPLAGMLMDQCIPLEALPLRLVAFSRCFRAEAGASGVGPRGLYRVHQFTKVEMFGVTTNDTGSESEELLHELLAIQEEIATELGLHFKVLEMPTEELGTPAYHKYDIEAWMPGRQEFGEITSASNCTEFQSRRLSIMYPDRQKGGLKRKYTHTVNATALAVPRILLAVMENYQNEDGSIDIPRVLQPFVGMQRIERTSDSRYHW